MEESAIIRMGLDARGVGEGLNTVEGMIKNFSGRVGSMFGSFKEHILGPLAGGAALAGLDKIISKTHELSNQAQNLDVGVEFFQEFAHAADEIGPGADKAVAGLRKMTVLLGQAKEGSEEAIGKFAKLGISLKDVASSDTEQMLFKVSDAIAKIKDPAERVAAAVDIAGKGGAQMAGMLAEGSNRLKEVMGTATALTESEVKALEGAHVRLKQIADTATVWAARVIGVFTHGIPTALGELTTGFDTIDKMLKGRAHDWADQQAAKISQSVGAEVAAEERAAAVVEQKKQALEEKLDALQTQYEKKKGERQRVEGGIDPNSDFGIAQRKGELVKEEARIKEKLATLEQGSEARARTLLALEEARLEIAKLTERQKQRAEGYARDSQNRKDAAAAGQQKEIGSLSDQIRKYGETPTDGRRPGNPMQQKLEDWRTNQKERQDDWLKEHSKNPYMDKLRGTDHPVAPAKQIEALKVQLQAIHTRLNGVLQVRGADE